MRGTVTRVITTLVLVSFAGIVTAGGRYANPPKGMVESHAACVKALDAAQKGEKEVALEQTKIARKISIESYKEISTMPMEVASSTTKRAIVAITADNMDDAIAELKHCKEKLDSEIDYYKKEGKL